MRLATRILILFIVAMAIVLYLMIASYLNQTMIIDYYRDALMKIYQLYLRSELEAGLDKKQVYFDNIGEHLRILLERFDSYNQRLFIQSIISFIVSMILFAFVMNSLRKHVFSRFNLIAEFVKNAYKQGLTHRRINLFGKDEISEFSELLNNSFDSLDECKRSLLGRSLQDRKIIECLINQSNTPCVYYRLNGDLLGSNLTITQEKASVSIVKNNLNQILQSNTDKKTFPFSDLQHLIITIIGTSNTEGTLIKGSLLNKDDLDINHNDPNNTHKSQTDLSDNASNTCDVEDDKT